MSDRHEAHLASVLQGRKTRNSGATFKDQGDGKQEYRSQEYVFCWDGKATEGKGITVTREMVEKIIEQAHWAQPMIALRWYRNARLTESIDWVAIELDTFAQMQSEANEASRLRAEVARLTARRGSP
jgi:hypothetical protein